MNVEYLSLPVTSRYDKAKAATADFADELLSHGSNARVIFEAVEADPDCALAQALAAACYLTQMTVPGRIQAKPHLVAAMQLAPYTTQREQQMVAAIAAWYCGDNASAIRILRELVECWPHDLVAAKLCQCLELDAGDFKGMLRTSAMAASVEGRAGHALGLHAFALEQMGEPRLAKRFGRLAIERSPGLDPWAQHAVAHALIALDQPLEARAFLHGHATDWDRCSSFMLTHNWWHLALLEIELGDEYAALALFDEHVWGVRKGHCQDQVNAISLLARLEMCGVDVGWRWDDIATHVQHRVDDRISGFLDLHYLYAMARSGRDEAADQLVRDLNAESDATLIGNLATGLLAYTRGDEYRAACAIGPIRRELPAMGGSNIQRALFEQIFADSARPQAVPIATVTHGNIHA